MGNAQAVAKVFTELTCWKCGEESLKEAGIAEAKHGSQGELLVAVDVKHSVCGKCSAFSVNSAQALLNKITGRKTRKERIRASNRSSK